MESQFGILSLLIDSLYAFSNSLAHSSNSFEKYAIVPLIFRSIKVGDELSAAAIVRGIENPIKRDSYYSNKLCKLDIIIITTSFVLFILCLI